MRNIVDYDKRKFTKDAYGNLIKRYKPHKRYNRQTRKEIIFKKGLSP